MRKIRQQTLQHEQKIVVVEQAAFPLHAGILLVQPGHVLGVGAQMVRLAPENLLQRQLLVPAFADEGEDGPAFGELAVSAPDAQPVPGLAQHVFGVASVHDGHASLESEQSCVLFEQGKGEAVEGASAYRAQILVAKKGPGAMQHFGRSLAGKGQKENFGG